MAQLPEPWLRGPLPGISPVLQPVGHALVGAREDVHRATEALTPAQLWAHPGGAASIGFHLIHLAGSTDRLFTYARGAVLSDEQRASLAAERASPEPAPPLDTLLAAWRATVDRALDQLAQTPDATLGHVRLVGRAQLPSTVLGLLAHAAEHAQRHTGQVITTAKIVRALGH
jgi:uncharacterized damage-inducible protein DinB